MKRYIIALLAVCMIFTAFSAFSASAATGTEIKYFLDTVGPMATIDMQNNKILASFTIAQAIWESGWGTSTLAKQANALFGIRAYSNWDGKVFNSTTKKVYDTYALASAESGSLWRAYDSWQESVDDHSSLFLKSDRYSNLIGNYDYALCCKYVVDDGYTSGTSYTKNLISLIESRELTKYDVGVDITPVTAQTDNTDETGRHVAEIPAATEPASNEYKLAFSGNVKYIVGDDLVISGVSEKTSVNDFLASLDKGMEHKLFDALGVQISEGIVAPGCKLLCYSGNIAIKAYDISVLGDADGDGSITINDYLSIKRYCVKSASLVGIWLAVADVDGDGNISTTDLIMIKRHLLHTYNLYS